MLLKLVGAITVAWAVAVILTSVFACNPIRGFWEPWIDPAPVCIDFKEFFMGNAIPNIVVDAVILALPVSQLARLQMSLRSKFAVGGMVMLGGL